MKNDNFSMTLLNISTDNMFFKGLRKKNTKGFLNKEKKKRDNKKTSVQTVNIWKLESPLYIFYGKN